MKKNIVVGLDKSGIHRLQTVWLPFLELHRGPRYNFLRMLQFEFYDMATMPERGDAMDHIDTNTDIVIAIHLNWQSVSLAPDVMYNRNNMDMANLCADVGARLICTHGEAPFCRDDATYQKAYRSI